MNGETHLHTPYDQPQFHLWYQRLFIRITVYNYTGVTKTQNSCCDIVAIMRWICGAARHVRPILRFGTKSPQTTCTSNTSSLQEVASDADTNSSLPIGWIWTKFHTLNRMYAFPLVKLKEDIIPTKSYHIWKPSASRPTLTHRTPLTLTP
jgi:hypothetical protein